MKVAVLTLSLHANYGGNLQAYALLTALRRMGHDAYYLNRERHKVPLWKAPFVVVSRLTKRYVLGRNVRIMTGITGRRQREVVAVHSKRFIGEYIQPQTPEILSSRQLAKSFPSMGFDAVVVGSDQVWRQRFVKDNIFDYFLGFIPDDDRRTRRVSYAASFGTSEWEYSRSETARCGELLRKFHAVSVREDSGVTQCRDKFDVVAEHVIDPTMLLSSEDYGLLMGDSPALPRGLLVYVLDVDDEKSKVIDFVSGRLGLSVFHVNGNAADREAAAESRIAPPVEDWLRGFRDADFVITDSFHGTVFAILFNKPFIAYGNPTRGVARFSSLLRMFGLESRLVDGYDGLEESMLESPDWASVNTNLEKLRSIAWRFLERALSSR